MKKINPLLAICLALIAACEIKAVATTETNNPEVKVELLFNIEDCRIYRFYDGGSSRHVAICGPVSAERRDAIVMGQFQRTHTRSNGENVNHLYLRARV